MESVSLLWPKTSLKTNRAVASFFNFIGETALLFLAQMAEIAIQSTTSVPIAPILKRLLLPACKLMRATDSFLNQDLSKILNPEDTFFSFLREACPAGKVSSFLFVQGTLPIRQRQCLFLQSWLPQAPFFHSLLTTSKFQHF